MFCVRVSVSLDLCLDDYCTNVFSASSSKVSKWMLLYQSLKKVPSGCRGQVDFHVGQVTFHSHLPNGQGPRQVICQLNCKKSNLRLAQGKQNLRATCPKGKLKFKFFSSPALWCYCIGVHSFRID